MGDVNSFSAFRIVPLLADAGIPMIAITLPGMLLLLAPVIALETIVIRKQTAIPFKSVLKANALANIASTILGMPLAWLAMLLLEFVTGGKHCAHSQISGQCGLGDASRKDSCNDR
jgi:hypothetical protein